MIIRQIAAVLALMCITSVVISGGSGLRPGELKALNDIHQNEQQERTRRTNARSTNNANAMSYGDRQRLEALQKEKSRILHAGGRQKLTARQRSALLNPIDQEIAAIKGAPVIIQKNTEQRSRSTSTKPKWLHDPYTGNTMTRTGSGYTDPRTGTFYQDSGGGVVNSRTGEFSPTH